MKRFFIITQPILILLISLFLNFCGGGVGGGVSSAPDPAHITIEANPSLVDSGDRTAVTVDIYDVNDLGIALKLKYPKGLDYVVSSASEITCKHMLQSQLVANKHQGILHTLFSIFRKVSLAITLEGYLYFFKATVRLMVKSKLMLT
jgi:hypothetical protein